jgi:hypothetical protein
MNAVLTLVEAQPDGVLYPKQAVLQLLKEALADGPPDQVISPGRASRELGWSKTRWTRWFRDGTVEGAFLDPTGRWRASRGACISVTESMRNGRQRTGGGLRGPRRKTRPAPGGPALGTQG